jgi:hypothetical protein
VRERFDPDHIRQPKTKLKIKRILLEVQRGHGLRPRAWMLLRSSARPACPRSGNERMSLSSPDRIPLHILRSSEDLFNLLDDLSIADRLASNDRLVRLQKDT